MELSEWRGLFLPRILERGGNYYRQRRVVSLFRQGDQIQAAVQGQELYRVTIDLWNDQLEYWECSCPFAAQGEPCKHLAAVFYAVEHSPFTKEPEEKEKEDGPLLEAVVKALPEERAKALLLLLAQRSKKNEELIRLQGEVPKNKQQEWKRKIDHILNRARGNEGFIECDCVWETMRSLEEFLQRLSSDLLFAGHVREAFLLTCYGFCAARRCPMDDPDGDFDELGEGCSEMWEEQVRQAPRDLQNEMYRWFCEAVLENGDEPGQEFLLQAVLKLFCEPEQLQNDLALLDGLIEKEKKRGHDRGDLAAKWLDIMETLGRPAGEVRAAEQKYWALPEVRRRAVNRLFALGKQKEAAAVLKESKTLDQKYPWLVRHASCQLIEYYREAGDERELLLELHFQVTNFLQRDLRYVREIRSYTPPERWPALREELLALPTLREVRCSLLAAEGLYKRLLEAVEQENSLNALDRWEEELRLRFPERMRALYAWQVETEMKTANDRSQYTELIAHLKKLEAYPQGELFAQNIAERWRQDYPRRRSMLEELDKAGY